MKTLILFLAVGFLLGPAKGSEPGFVKTYQPLDGLANEEVHVEPVICVSSHAYSDDDHTLAMAFISRPNTPPNDLHGIPVNINLASEIGLTFAVRHIDSEASQIVLSFEPPSADDTGTGEEFRRTRKAIFTASLECLRLCAPANLKSASVIISTKSTDKEWLVEIAGRYNRHKKDAPFHPDLENQSGPRD